MQKRILDISVVKADDKWYCCKSSVCFTGEKRASLIIAKIEEVNGYMKGSTSFNKVKVLFDMNEEKLNKVKFRKLIMSLTEELKYKYKITDFLLKI